MLVSRTGSSPATILAEAFDHSPYQLKSSNLCKLGAASMNDTRDGAGDSSELHGSLSSGDASDTVGNNTHACSEHAVRSEQVGGEGAAGTAHLAEACRRADTSSRSISSDALHEWTQNGNEWIGRPVCRIFLSDRTKRQKKVSVQRAEGVVTGWMPGGEDDHLRDEPAVWHVSYEDGSSGVLEKREVRLLYSSAKCRCFSGKAARCAQPHSNFESRGCGWWCWGYGKGA